MDTVTLNESPESVFSLERISDADLLAATRQLVGRSNQLLAALLAHLAEVEVRGIHRLRACSSLYTYCVFELRLSEDAAFRRVRAAKLARQFPVIFQQIADGELQLTTLAATNTPADTALADTPLAGTTAPPRAEAATLLPQRYRVEFTASQQYADLLNRAQDLLSHAVPNRSLEEIHVLALRLLVEKLERSKYGAPRKDAPPTAKTNEPRVPGARASSEKPAPVMPAPVMPARSKKRSRVPRQRESVPMAVRREVLDRDGACCSFHQDRRSVGSRCVGS